MDTETLSLIVSPVAGLVGVVVGALINRKSTLVAAREERNWSSRQLVRQRKEEAAANLDRSVVEAYADAPSTVDARDAWDELIPLQTRLMQARAQNAVLDDSEIERRFQSLLMTVGMASRSRNFRRDVQEAQALNLYPLQIAVRELREALIHYQQREPPPPAKYPTSKELIGIVHAGGRDNFEAINDWLIEHEVG